MNWILISGLSGAGKSITVHALEDLGYFCVDNLPMTLLPQLAKGLKADGPHRAAHAAVVIDARGAGYGLEAFSGVLKELRAGGVDPRVVFLEAEEEVLITRFKETRRKHPLSSHECPLAEAIARERSLLAPVREAADIIIDTTYTHLHQLRDLVRQRVEPMAPQKFSVLLQSFGYKHGLPQDADIVFDGRCLPNPYWEPSLRALSGRDEDVIRFMDAQPASAKMLTSLIEFLEEWLPYFETDNRVYLNVSVGCTGGQHRSVYLVEKLAKHLNAVHKGVIVRHRELI